MKALRTLYFIVANTVILFLLVVTTSHFAVKGYYHLRNKSKYENLSTWVKRNYSHMIQADVEDLISHTPSHNYRLEPWVGFREKPVRSRFVNVSDYGARSNGKVLASILEIQNAIWFFGGSTTFGYGVADWETIPAQIEKLLTRSVVNFGRADFYSEPENRELVQYLRLGYRPSMVIFLDGVNESCELYEAPFNDELKRVAEALWGYRWDPLEVAKPAIYAFSRLSLKIKKLAGLNVVEAAGNDLVCERYGKQQMLRTLHAQILAERESICHLYSLKCWTFVQPFGGVHGRYDDPAYLKESRKYKRELFTHLEGNWQTAGAIFVTDALDRYEQHAYLDEDHYGAAGCRLIAEAIAPKLTTRGP